MNISGRGVNISCRGVNISGRGVNISGRGVNISCRDVNISDRGVNKFSHQERLSAAPPSPAAENLEYCSGRVTQKKSCGLVVTGKLTIRKKGEGVKNVELINPCNPVKHKPNY